MNYFTKHKNIFARRLYVRVLFLIEMLIQKLMYILTVWIEKKNGIFYFVEKNMFAKVSQKITLVYFKNT